MGFDICGLTDLRFSRAARTRILTLRSDDAAGCFGCKRELCRAVLTEKDNCRLQTAEQESCA